jgi:hypothetical protein
MEEIGGRGLYLHVSEITLLELIPHWGHYEAPALFTHLTSWHSCFSYST